MFTYTFRLRRSAVITALIVTAAVAVALCLLPGERAIAAMSTAKPPRCESNEDRVDWLETMGWDVEETPCSELSVIIPRKFDELYSQYAVLQRQAGFRLERHRGKTVQKYCYIVKNYGDGKETAVISILQRGDKVIGGDISSARLGGFLKALLPRDQTKMA